MPRQAGAAARLGLPTARFGDSHDRPPCRPPAHPPARPPYLRPPLHPPARHRAPSPPRPAARAMPRSARCC
eukprot:scaffold8005_cov118-Isochrysis_galbana.AAC.21